MTVQYSELSWPQLKAAAELGSIVIVPVGATEQHGHHLPIEVDWRLCATIAEASCHAAAARGVRALVTPPIWTGFSPHHMEFSGSITLSTSTFLGLVGDVARSLWHHGFRRILLLNGHGGNANLLRSLVQQLRFEDSIRVAAASYWDFAVPFIQNWRRSGPGGINHACEMETALMLAVRPELVNMSLAHDATWPPTSSYLSADLAMGAPVTIARSFAEITSDGVVGAAALATVEGGEELRAAIVERVAAFLVEFATWDWASSV